MKVFSGGAVLNYLILANTQSYGRDLRRVEYGNERDAKQRAQLFQDFADDARERVAPSPDVLTKNIAAHRLGAAARLKMERTQVNQ